MEKGEFTEIERKVSDTVTYLKAHGLDGEQIKGLFDKSLQEPHEGIKIPISAFNNDTLSGLETIAKYLRENMLLSFKQIAELTNRSNIALAVTYRNAKRKRGERLNEEVSPYALPVSVIKDRNLSVLENIVSYLKDNFALNYHQIALLLNRNDRTIWTVYQRARRKKGIGENKGFS